MGIKKHIPNFLTLMNLFFGCLAAVEAFNANFTCSFWFMTASLTCDFLDGFMARLLGSYSDIGRELDSLADDISFGFVPGIIMWRMGGDLAFLAFLIPVFSALRLAKFNIDTRNHDVFYGLATPANAFFFASLGYVSHKFPDSWISIAIGYEWVRIALIVLFSLLMVSNIPMFSLKFKSWKLQDNVIPYSFILLSAVSVAIFGVKAVIFIILAYVLLSLGTWASKKKTV